MHMRGARIGLEAPEIGRRRYERVTTDSQSNQKNWEEGGGPRKRFYQKIRAILDKALRSKPLESGSVKSMSTLSVSGWTVARRDATNLVAQKNQVRVTCSVGPTCEIGTEQQAQNDTGGAAWKGEGPLLSPIGREASARKGAPPSKESKKRQRIPALPTRTERKSKETTTERSAKSY